MSIEGQGHFLTIFFQVLYVLSVYRTIGTLVIMILDRIRIVYCLYAKLTIFVQFQDEMIRFRSRCLTRNKSHILLYYI